MDYRAGPERLIQDGTFYQIEVEGAPVHVYLDRVANSYYICSESRPAMDYIANKVRPLWNSYADLSFGEFLIKTFSHE